MKIFGLNITKDIVNLDVKRPSNGAAGDSIEDQQVYRSRQDIAKWRTALTYAESIDLPNRISLVEIYRDTVLDAHLSSVIQTRKINVLSKHFNIKNSDGEINEEMTEIFNSAWFRKFTDLALDSIFWGTTVIEFGDILEDKLTDIKRIPYESINPELEIVKKYQDSSDIGVKYNESPFTEWNVEILEREPFGLLNKCIPLILWKKDALGAWSLRSTIFGMPFRIGKTDTRNPESRNRMISMMQTMGTAGWAVVDEEDEIQLVESGGTSGHDIYKDLISEANSEISKLILGQTGTTDEKAFVGSAEVHERVSNAYTNSDLKWFSNVVNGQLIPKLQKLGLVSENVEFGFDSKEVLTIAEQLEVDKVLLEHYTIPTDVIEQRYGSKVEIREVEQRKPAPINNSVFNEVQNAYKEFFEEKNCC